MKNAMEKLENFLNLGGIKKDITLLVISGIALLISIFDVFDLPFDMAWIAIILCGVPIVLEAVIGLVTAFDIKADVLVSLALIASVGTPAAPGAGAVILFTILSGVGFTNDAALMAYTLILAINRPIEMLVTSLNCVGDSTACLFVAKKEKLLNEKTYNEK